MLNNERIFSYILYNKMYSPKNKGNNTNNTPPKIQTFTKSKGKGVSVLVGKFKLH